MCFALYRNSNVYSTSIEFSLSKVYWPLIPVQPIKVVIMYYFVNMKCLSTLVVLLVSPMVSSFNVNIENTRTLRFKLNMSQSAGSAARPLEKKRIAVFGAGGYLGATIFGFLQRACSIYGTGIGAPRAIVATAVGAISLNKIISQSFKLAFAGEDLIRLTNMEEVNHIKERLKGFDAAILATTYTCESRPITLNSYNLTPNQKTLEIYMDDRYGVDGSLQNDMNAHLARFQNTVQACKEAGLQHIVVVESPNTNNPRPFAEILDKIGIPFTYVHASGSIENTKFYTFEKGIQFDVGIEGFTLSHKYLDRAGYMNGDWSDRFISDSKSNKKQSIAREDLAAVVVQGLMSLDWSRSRCLDVWSDGKRVTQTQDDGTYVPRKMLKSDRYWCVNSDIIENRLINID